MGKILWGVLVSVCNREAANNLLFYNKLLAVNKNEIGFKKFFVVWSIQFNN